MTNEEAIKYLKQLYPNGGHCWLDEQRIEAVGMAIEALKEASVSEDLEKEIDSYFAKWLQGASDEGCFNPDSQLVSIYDCHRIARHFANWQKKKDESYTKSMYKVGINAGKVLMKEQLMAKAVDGNITFDYYGDDDKTYGCIAHDSFCLEDFGLKDTNKVKLIVITEG